MSDLHRRRRSFFAFASALVAMVGCGSAAAPSDAPNPAPAPTTNAPGPATAPSPPATPPDDHGKVSTTYPAFTPSVAQLVNRGGRVLTSPVVVTITWADDPNVAVLESVGDTIGASSFWHEVVGEYGVGAATSGPLNHVHLTTPIVLPTDPNVDPIAPITKLITDSLADPTASGWPAPTAQTVYLVFLHGQNALTLCQSGAGGLHQSLTVGGKDVPFAISAACADPGSKAGSSALESATISASHELAEAAIDPFPDTTPAWQGLEDAQLAWELLQMGQDENADMCEFYDDAYGLHGAPQLPFFVQRSWSNKSAAAGHSPCVPRTLAPNFNVTPLMAPDTIVADFSKSDVPLNPTSKGYLVGVGKSRKIPLGVYTDAATSPLSLEVFESDPFSQDGSPFDRTTRPSLSVALDKTSGQNGEKTYLTVKVESETAEKAHLVVVRSTLDGVSRYMPILIGTAGTPAPASR